MRRLRPRPSAGSDPLAEVLTPSAEDRRYLGSLHDESVPLPAGAEQELRRDNPRLRELRRHYAALDLPVTRASRWDPEAIESFLDLRWFRGETLITWHYRELPRVTRLKYFVLLDYVLERDELGLLESLDEDGAFGCWTYEYPGRPKVSRDLLDSVNEISFLERHLGLSRRPGVRVLDIGAGYGRLAHRMCSGLSNLKDYCCVDAIAESTFVCEYYLRYRGCSPPARVVSLDRVQHELRPGSFDLALNVHSFSECPLEAVAWWMDELVRLAPQWLLVVPNEPEKMLSLEPDGSRRNFLPLLEAAGYALHAREPVLDDPAVAELLRHDDHFHLFRRAG